MKSTVEEVKMKVAEVEQGTDCRCWTPINRIGVFTTSSMRISIGSAVFLRRSGVSALMRGPSLRSSHRVRGLIPVHLGGD